MMSGLAVFLTQVFYDSSRKTFLSDDQFYDGALAGIVGGLVGGKVLFVLSEGALSFHSFTTFIESLTGGFAILGGMLGAITGVTLFLRCNQIPLLPVFDIAGAYALSAHAIARWGCLMAGCCFGVVSHSSWFYLLYTHPASLAPLHTPLFPAQLVMSIASFIGFLCIRFFVYRRKGLAVGSTFIAYILWETIARYCIDFYRADRVMHGGSLSSYQWVALGMTIACIAALVGMAWSKKEDRS
jgi:phosphatidylglycerol:prolipoprotein diacylglycerol transferase